MQSFLMVLAHSRMASKVRSFMQSERGEVNVVAIVVLIGIAVVLALLFKEKITELLETLFEQINGNASDAVARGE